MTSTDVIEDSIEKAKRERKQFLSKCFDFLIGICFAIFIAWFILKSLLGFSLVRVNSGSMAPFYQVNTFHVCKEVEMYEHPLHVGDVAVYERDSGEKVMHRIVEVTRDGYIFKGDANPVNDPEVKKSQVRCVVLL